MMNSLANTTLVTGIPRSGTNLLCSLLNKQNNIVASSEPKGILLSTESKMTEHLDWCLSQIRKWREQVQFEGTVYTRHIDGVIPDNWLKKEKDYQDTRLGKITYDNILIKKKIDEDFHFVIKSPGAFTALLPALVNAPVNLIALIRNPLAVLASWNSTTFPVYYGRLPPGEKIDKNLRRDLSETPDRIDRQLLLLSWFFCRYDMYLSSDNIYRYEQLTASPARVIQSIIGRVCDAQFDLLRKRNVLADYPTVDVRMLAERLLDSNGAYWTFYSKDGIRKILGKNRKT